MPVRNAFDNSKNIIITSLCHKHISFMKRVSIYGLLSTNFKCCLQLYHYGKQTLHKFKSLNYLSTPLLSLEIMDGGRNTFGLFRESFVDSGAEATEPKHAFSFYTAEYRLGFSYKFPPKTWHINNIRYLKHISSTTANFHTLKV